MPSITHPGCTKYFQICDLQDGPISDCAQNLYSDDESDLSYTPGESDLESFSDDSSEEEEEDDSETEDTIPDVRTPVIGTKAKGTPKKTNPAVSRRTRSHKRVRFVWNKTFLFFPVIPFSHISMLLSYL